MALANPLYNALGPKMPLPNGFGNLLSQFNQFRRNFTGDPKAQVQELLNSGRMTQAQYNQIAQMASVFQRFIK